MSVGAYNLAFVGPPRVNLLPAAYEARCQRARRLRGWIVLGAMLLTLQMTVAGALREMSGETRDLQQGVLAAAKQEQTVRNRIAGLGIEQSSMDKQIELAEHLNRKHRWSELLAVLAENLPPTVVLTNCESDPPKSAGQNRSAVSAKTVSAVVSKAAKGKGGAKPEEVPDVATGLLITGVATGHDSVAHLLRNLNSGGKLGRCSLQSTVRQPYLKGEGVFFTIRTQW